MAMLPGQLARSEPPLGPEVVQYLLDTDTDTDTHTWSMRRSKANCFRVVGCLSHVATAGGRTGCAGGSTRRFFAIVLCPEMILPTVCLYLFLVLLWHYSLLPREPTGLSPDQLDEEFDGLPSGRPTDVMRMRYDRLCAVAGARRRCWATWRRRGSASRRYCPSTTRMPWGVRGRILPTALVRYAVPFKVLLLGMGFFYLRHPRFRGDMLSARFNFLLATAVTI